MGRNSPRACHRPSSLRILARASHLVLSVEIEDVELSVVGDALCEVHHGRGVQRQIAFKHVHEA